MDSDNNQNSETELTQSKAEYLSQMMKAYYAVASNARQQNIAPITITEHQDWSRECVEWFMRH